MLSDKKSGKWYDFLGDADYPVDGREIAEASAFFAGTQNSNTEKLKMTEFDSIKAQTVAFLCGSIFREHIYKNRDDAQMEAFFAQAEESAPDSGKFYGAWFRAFVAVARNDGKKSCDNFLGALEALSSIKDASALSDNLPAFLQQGFAFFMYIGDEESARKFWTEGAMRGFFAKPDTESFFRKLFAKFNAKEQFWVQFQPDMFVDEVKARTKAKSDYKKSAETDDALLKSINDADEAAFIAAAAGCDFSKRLINGVSPLYYAIQRKGTIKSGAGKFTDDIVQIQAESMVAKLDLDKFPEEMRNKQILEIFHQMRSTYEKSGLGKIMFSAFFGEDDELPQKSDALAGIIKRLVELTPDVDSFSKDTGNRTATNALLLAAEIGDEETVRLLVEKGADVDKPLGFAKFGMRYKDGTSISTDIPNSAVYRMISFSQFGVLRQYLERFPAKAKRAMTAKTAKCDITPLVYFILSTLYASKDEESYGRNKKLVDEFLPIFTGAGAVINENTAFGSAEKLLGL